MRCPGALVCANRSLAEIRKGLLQRSVVGSIPEDSRCRIAKILTNRASTMVWNFSRPGQTRLCPWTIQLRVGIRIILIIRCSAPWLADSSRTETGYPLLLIMMALVMLLLMHCCASSWRLSWHRVGNHALMTKSDRCTGSLADANHFAS